MAASTFPLFANLSFVLPGEFEGREHLVKLLVEHGGTILEEENATEDAIYVFANFEEVQFMRIFPDCSPSHFGSRNLKNENHAETEY
jgi:hypothetical protein